MEQDNNYELNLSWQQKASALLTSVKNELLNDKIFYTYCFISTAVIYLCSLYLDFPIDYSFTTYLETLIQALYVTGLSWCIYYYFYLILSKEKQPAKRFIQKLKHLIFPLYRPVSVFVSMMALNLIFSNHTFLKSLIPIINPFKWDLTFANIDSLLHFGVAPWELTHALFSNAWASLGLNVAYNAWFFCMWGILIFFLIYKKYPLVRQQFLLTFALSWMILGVFFATLLSSAGPCYVELITGDEQFVPLMKTLEAQSQYLTNVDAGQLWALPTQQYLWDEYIANANGIGSGISAMPSLHVSIAVLMALSIYRLNKTIGYFAYAFAVIIQIGSVHLAWHYAIDGYLATLLTVMLWKIVGWALRRYASYPERRE
ncbi:phosphatase PAP2 family protein [Vibrio alginolyticus]|uniref:phosphatase PAP2 family protein n=1 Tax=Vibrio alginolyticus TaxID=663 RepID=UPI00215BEC83|nr:phosphatase PAP2 family protein [Vibrio alginolyticus]ELB2783817.1 phosphatase PAP2 family protein [Vibrio alginolyticus]MCR9923862.1 phosphatase PAP2 family protein [Vibrio alginolyticus]